MNTRPLHLLSKSTGGIRVARATDDEIIAAAAGELDGYNVVEVSITDDGDVDAVQLDSNAFKREVEKALARRKVASISTTTDDIGKILALLDKALAAFELIAPFSELPGLVTRNVITLWPEKMPNAEEALRLWADARGFTFTEGWSHYEDNTSIRSIEVKKPGSWIPVVSAQWTKTTTDAAKAFNERRRAILEQAPVPA